jgi:hypothetical protein
MNERAAFVVSGLGPQKTYYYYPGIVTDAVALDGCVQTGTERLDEIGWLVMEPNLGDFPQSIITAIRGEAAEVVADGADGGPVRMRVSGVTDTHWLLENELIRRALVGGDRRPFAGPRGLETQLDYVLAPDSAVLRMELTLRNASGEERRLAVAAQNLFGDTAPVTFFSEIGLDVGGLGARVGLPWVVSRASAQDGAWALAMEDGNMALAHVSGVDAFVDADALLRPIPLAAGEEVTLVWLLAVGGRDANSAVRHLQSANPLGLRNSAYMLAELDGVVRDETDGTAVAGAEVVVQMQRRDGDWDALDALTTDADGAFTGALPSTGNPLRLQVTAPGRLNAAPVALDLAAPGPVELIAPPAGALVYRITDGSGAAMPARVELWQGDRRTHRLYAAVDAERRAPVAPGAYELSVTRGFEYSIHTQAIEIPPSGELRVEVQLDRVLDTPGWLSTDSHQHAGPSPDSAIDILSRLEMVAAAGVEVAIGTDHEIISDWPGTRTGSGLEPWLGAVQGQEVTASLPEHVNAYPMQTDPAHPRGRPVVWYGLDPGGVYAAARDRGAGVVQLNHPRNGCGFLCLVGYDREIGEPTMTDPTAFGWPADGQVWSWDFNAIELMNGHRSPFLDPDSPQTTGLFDDWASFLNFGHRITAVAVTDVHGEKLGSPRTFFRAPTDDPAEFEDAMLVRAYVEGRAQVSAGAFIEAGVGDAGVGDLVAAVEGGVTLDIQVQALPEIELSHVIVFADCDAVVKLPIGPGEGARRFQAEVPVEFARDGWLAVAVMGSEPMPRALDAQYDAARVPRALTNAIFVDADGDGEWTPPGGKFCDYDLSAP